MTSSLSGSAQMLLPMQMMSRKWCGAATSHSRGLQPPSRTGPLRIVCPPNLLRVRPAQDVIGDAYFAIAGHTRPDDGTHATRMIDQALDMLAVRPDKTAPSFRSDILRRECGGAVTGTSKPPHMSGACVSPTDHVENGDAGRERRRLVLAQDSHRHPHGARYAPLRRLAEQNRGVDPSTWRRGLTTPAPALTGACSRWGGRHQVSGALPPALTFLCGQAHIGSRRLLLLSEA